MNLQDFKKKVRAEFGDGLKHATPANVRDFVMRMDIETLELKPGERIDITSSQVRSYEEAIKYFFAGVLQLPCEEALMKLYTVALDLAFVVIESEYADKMSDIFRELDEP